MDSSVSLSNTFIGLLSLISVLFSSGKFANFSLLKNLLSKRGTSKVPYTPHIRNLKKLAASFIFTLGIFSSKINNEGYCLVRKTRMKVCNK